MTTVRATPRTDPSTAPEIVTVPLRVLPAEGPLDPSPDPRLAAFDRSSWYGHDGRPARIVWLGQRQGLRARR